MKRFEITIITHPEKDTEGEHFKTFVIEAGDHTAYFDKGAHLFSTEDIVKMIIPINACIIRVID